MRVVMTKSMPGSEDGVHVQRYQEGETYDLGEALARSFVGSKCARPAPELPKEPPAGGKEKDVKGTDGGGKTKVGKGPDEDK